MYKLLFILKPVSGASMYHLEFNTRESAELVYHKVWKFGIDGLSAVRLYE